MDKQHYQSMLDKLLKTIAFEVCEPCSQPQKKNHFINLASPLDCTCRCSKTTNTLMVAAEWQASLLDVS